MACGGFRVEAFRGEERQIDGADLDGPVRVVYGMDTKIAEHTFEFRPDCEHGLQMRAARDKMDFISSGRQQRVAIAAELSGTDDGDPQQNGLCARNEYPVVGRGTGEGRFAQMSSM